VTGGQQVSKGQGATAGRGWVSTAELADAHAVAAWSGGGEQERRGGLDY
jgi:hypothetical protein